MMYTVQVKRKNKYEAEQNVTVVYSKKMMGI